MGGGGGSRRPGTATEDIMTGGSQTSNACDGAFFFANVQKEGKKKKYDYKDEIITGMLPQTCVVINCVCHIILHTPFWPSQLMMSWG